MFIKLGKKAHFFYDPVEKIKLLPGDILEIKGRPANGVFKRALAGGHIEITEDPNPPVVIEEKVEVIEETPDPLESNTKKEILALFDYFVDDDLEVAGKLNKADLIAFVRETEKSYAD